MSGINRYYHGETGNSPYLFSDSGIAVRLQWKKKNNRTYWVLSYKEKKYSLKIKKVMGDKKNHVVDPGIRPGDKIGRYMLNADTPVWMRSEKLDLTPDQVYNQYPAVFAMPPIPGPWPLSELSARARKLMLTAGWALVIGSAFGLFQLIRHLTGKIECPPELTLDQFQWILNANIILFFTSVLIYGFYSLKYHGHPMQFEWRTGWHTIRYCIKALGVIVLDTVCKPLIFFFGIAALYTIPAIILLHGLQPILKINADTAFSYVYTGVYFLWIIYIGWRFWRLFVEGPDYIYEPSFVAGYTEGIGRPRRS